MNGRRSVVLVAALAIALGLWFAVKSGRMGSGATPDTATTLQVAGVHKCVGAGGTSYIDGPCPKGTREVAAKGGTMTVTSFPKPAPAPSALASGVLGGPLVRPVDTDERDRLREKAIDDAANRK